FRYGFPGVTVVLNEIDDCGVVQVRMVFVAGDAERAATDQGDVVRLRWVRGALPVKRDAVGVRELCHVRCGAVDGGDVMVLEEDDDELVEVVRGFSRNRIGTRRVVRSPDRDDSGGQGHDAEGDGRHGGTKR